MLSSVVLWLIGSKIGRYVATAVVTTVTLALVVARIFAKGQSYEKSKQREAELSKLQNAAKVRQEVSKLSKPQRDSYADKWLRDDE